MLNLHKLKKGFEKRSEKYGIYYVRMSDLVALLTLDLKKIKKLVKSISFDI